MKTYALYLVFPTKFLASLSCMHSFKSLTFKMVAEVSASNEFKLNDPPADGVTAVKFSPTSSNFLIASSWDKVL